MELCHNVKDHDKSELLLQLSVILQSDPSVVHIKDVTFYGMTILHYAAESVGLLPEFCKLLKDVNPNLLKAILSGLLQLFHWSELHGIICYVPPDTSNVIVKLPPPLWTKMVDTQQST
eukprot:scaffold33995_cov56-Cyclotella_meneghiniana.AAC.1